MLYLGELVQVPVPISPLRSEENGYFNVFILTLKWVVMLFGEVGGTRLEVEGPRVSAQLVSNLCAFPLVTTFLCFSVLDCRLLKSYNLLNVHWVPDTSAWCFMCILCYLQQQSKYNGNVGPERQVVFKIPQVSSGRAGIRGHIFHSKACVLATPTLFHLVFDMGTYHLILPKVVARSRYQLSLCFWLLQFDSYREAMSRSHVVSTSWVQIPALLLTSFEHWASYLVSPCISFVMYQMNMIMVPVSCGVMRIRRALWIVLCM